MQLDQSVKMLKNSIEIEETCLYDKYLPCQQSHRKDIGHERVLRHQGLLEPIKLDLPFGSLVYRG
jgi:hypothetical protein